MCLYTGGPGLDFTQKRFFQFFLTCYRDAYGYIKKVWIVDNAINNPLGAVWHAFLWFTHHQGGLKWQN